MKRIMLCFLATLCMAGSLCAQGTSIKSTTVKTTRKIVVEKYKYSLPSQWDKGFKLSLDFFGWPYTAGLNGGWRINKNYLAGAGWFFTFYSFNPSYWEENLMTGPEAFFQWDFMHREKFSLYARINLKFSIHTPWNNFEYPFKDSNKIRKELEKAIGVTGNTLLGFENAKLQQPVEIQAGVLTKLGFYFSMGLAFQFYECDVGVPFSLMYSSIWDSVTTLGSYRGGYRLMFTITAGYSLPLGKRTKTRVL